MFKKVSYSERMNEAVKALAGDGAFLTVSANNITNTMTIGWGSIGYIWGKPILMVAVRDSRFTLGLLEQAGEFTVSIPFSGLTDELRVCGTKSGRDQDKISLCNLAITAAENVSAPIIAECDLHYECKVVYKTKMDPALLALGLQKWYRNGDYHTLFFGEIVSCYEKAVE